MASGDILMLRLVASCVPVAKHAGKIIRDVMKKGELNIVDKGIKDFQTEADRQAQQFIISALSKQFPKVTIIGEEGEHVPSSDDISFNEQDQSVLQKEYPKNLMNIDESRITVWVDPLDGTSEYTQGLLEHVTVLIGIAVDSKAVAGVIHQPYYGHKEDENTSGRTIWGIVGLGAFGHSPVELPKDKLIITTTRSHSNSIVQDAIQALSPTEVLRVGGAGHKVLLLIEGKAHAYIFASSGCKRWDTCAPEAILNAAGGLLTDINGTLYPYNKETEVVNEMGVFATAKKDDHIILLSQLPENVKKSFLK